VAAHSQAKICDFGLAKHASTTTASTYTPTTKAYTLEYTSPERLQEFTRSYQDDVYAFGIFMYFIASCDSPFHNIDKSTGPPLHSSFAPAPNISPSNHPVSQPDQLLTHGSQATASAAITQTAHALPPFITILPDVHLHQPHDPSASTACNLAALQLESCLATDSHAGAHDLSPKYRCCAGIRTHPGTHSATMPPDSQLPAPNPCYGHTGQPLMTTSSCAETREGGCVVVVMHCRRIGQRIARHSRASPWADDEVWPACCELDCLPLTGLLPTTPLCIYQEYMCRKQLACCMPHIQQS
jgi:serine/threonine protein kinase